MERLTARSGEKQNRIATKSMRPREVAKVLKNVQGQKSRGLKTYDPREAIGLAENG
jgi:hypothetical protein